MTFWLIAASLVYIVTLFLIARWGDRHADNETSLARHPAVYALALGIYCTSWTYFGSVGAASQNGWQFLPIYLGPTLLLTLGFPLLKKLILVSKKQNITSIADFVASRYGKRQLTALLVTLLMTLAAVPYIALQLKAINTSFVVVADLTDSSHWSSAFEALIATVFLAVFVILFGVRKADVTEYRSGLMLAIASESLVKLLGLATAAFIAWNLIKTNTDIDISTQMVSGAWSLHRWYSFEFIVQTLMAAAAFLCLPRQFHVMVVDNAKLSDLNTARWLSSGYLILIALLIVPIAIMGSNLLSSSGISPDTLTMQLPLHIGNNAAAILVFIGGLSAATAMIIVATLTLGTMWTNEVIMPLLLKRDARQIIHQKQYHKRIILIRRISISMILALSFIYYQFLTQRIALHGIGLIAFSLVIQILPAIIGGLYWRKGHASGVYAGLLGGFICWLMFLIMPLAMSEPGQVSAIISRGVVISVLVNTFAYILFSKLASERLIDKIQASAFVQPNKTETQTIRHISDIKAVNQDLKDLLETFLGQDRCSGLLNDYQQHNDLNLVLNAKVDAEFADFCERQLAGVLGTSSATTMINIVLSGKQLDLGEVVNFFDDTTKALQTNQAILFNSLESVNQGISVVDRELNLVAWNKAYLKLFDYPEGLVQVGSPIAELIRFNANRGECGQGDIEQLVDKRLQHMKKGNPHNFIRRRSDGRIIEMTGNPLPNGGFVTSFSDITRHIESQKALQEANIDLEENVQEQMAQISEISAELKQAKLAAEQANATKTRFLALASHDILQPLNAARLYLSSLEESQLANEQKTVVQKVDNSLQATEDLISTLLEISRLEQGALKANLSHFKLSDILNSLTSDIEQSCEQKGLKFKQRWQDHTVYSDSTYLRRIIQNLLTNAVKYTPKGTVLFAIRTIKNKLKIQVWDTGAGISDAEQKRIFTDFYRAHPELSSGAGLGLSVVMRMSEQLNVPINLSSVPGKGSCFTVTVELGDQEQVINQAEAVAVQTDTFAGLNIMCVDDNPENLDAIKTLMDKWHCKVNCFTNVADAAQFAEQNPAPDVLLIDYQLEPDNTDGLELINWLRSYWATQIPASLVTAVKTDELKKECKDNQVNYMSKPIKPARLKSWLKSIG